VHGGNGLTRHSSGLPTAGNVCVLRVGWLRRCQPLNSNVKSSQKVMPTSSDHGRLIAGAAKKILAPLGCKQKGRSRLWFDDHLWWVGVVEFQPSAWARGSSLNVGAMWLWSAKDYWSFDDGYRVDSFKEFKNQDQFAEAAEKLAGLAASEIVALRQKFHSVSATSVLLAQKNKNTIWDRYHAGVSLALAGNLDSAQAELQAAQCDTEHAQWVTDLKAKCKALSSTFTSAETARESVRREVDHARKLLGLTPLEDKGSIWDCAS